MTRIKPGKYFPLSVLRKLENPRVEGELIVTDSTCEGVWKITEKEIETDYRDLIFAFSLVSTATILGVLGVFWDTYVIVRDHLLPVGIATYVFSLGASAFFGFMRRRKFLKNIILECDEG